MSAASEEYPCGEVHGSFFDARFCAAKHKRSPESFGDLVDEINLWWGEELFEADGRPCNLGYVIGLKNIAAGIWWKLEWRKRGGARLTQGEIVETQWRTIYHPIKFSESLGDILSKYDDRFWVHYFWNWWTLNHTDKMPAEILAELNRRRIDIVRRGPFL